MKFSIQFLVLSGIVEDEFHNTSVQQNYWDMTIRKKVRKTTYAGFISYRDSLRNLQHIDHAEY